VLANLGVYRFYRREHPDEFHWFKHIVVPLFSSAGLLWVGYKSIFPLPPKPEGYAPPIVAVWLVIGVAILWFMHRRGTEGEFLQRAGQAVDESA
jgi:amino acid transporter